MVECRIKFATKPDSRKQFLEVARTLIGPIRITPGCSMSTLLNDVEATGTYVLVCRWADPADLERFIKSAQFRGLMVATELLGQPPEFHVYSVTDTHLLSHPEDLHDVLDRLQMAAAGAQSLNGVKKAYEAIINDASIGIALIGPKMEVLELNAKMREWFPDIDLGKCPVAFRTSNDPLRNEICSYCPTRETLRDGQVHETIAEFQNGNGHRRFRIVSAPIFNSRGAVTAAIEVVEEITEPRSEV